MTSPDPPAAFLSSIGVTEDDAALNALFAGCLDGLLAELDAVELTPAVQSRWRRFERWCAKAGPDPYACTEDAVASYLEEIGKFRRGKHGRIVEVERSGSMLWV